MAQSIPTQTPPHMQSRFVPVVLTLVGVMVVVVACVVVFTQFVRPTQKTANPSDTSIMPKTQDIVPYADVKVNDEFAKKVQERTFEELRAENPSVANPNISSQEVRDQLAEKGAINKNPVNHFINFTGTAFEPASIQIARGDAVTFRNNSKQDLDVIGESWRSTLSFAPTKAFTQQFDFKGVYKYVASPSQSISGSITVE